MKKLVVTGLGILFILAINACQDEKQIEFDRYYSAGAAVYQSHCQNCHGDKGQGLAALIPPLTDSVYLHQNKAQLPCFLQNGLKGKINVANKVFEGEMPASKLSPIEIAQVVTYVSNSFGNKQGLSDNDNVQSLLKNCK